MEGKSRPASWAWGLGLEQSWLVRPGLVLSLEQNCLVEPAGGPGAVLPSGCIAPNEGPSLTKPQGGDSCWGWISTNPQQLTLMAPSVGLRGDSPMPGTVPKPAGLTPAALEASKARGPPHPCGGHLEGFICIGLDTGPSVGGLSSRIWTEGGPPVQLGPGAWVGHPSATVALGCFPPSRS